MQNMSSIINSRNRKLLQKADSQESTCNCRNRNNCPLDGKCLTKSTVYRAEVSSTSTNASYIGICEGPFKERFNNHTKSLRHRKYRLQTELSKLVWELKDKAENPTIKWSIETKTQPYKSGTRKCDLCDSEILLITKNLSGKLHQQEIGIGL